MFFGVQTSVTLENATIYSKDLTVNVCEALCLLVSLNKLVKNKFMFFKVVEISKTKPP